MGNPQLGERGQVPQRTDTVLRRLLAIGSKLDGESTQVALPTRPLLPRPPPCGLRMLRAGPQHCPLQSDTQTSCRPARSTTHTSCLPSDTVES